MFKRKMGEIGSGLYRCLVFPFQRIKIEKKTNSIMRQKSYIFDGSILCGKNYIGKNTLLKNTTVGFGSYVNNDCDLTDTRIGKYSSIGTGVKTVLGNHPLDGHVALHPAFYSKAGALGYTYVDKDTYEEFSYIDEENRFQVSIGNDVWIGNDVRILGGVTIADGCAIGAEALVTKDTVPYGIYAGIPAKLIRKRFDDETITVLSEQKWWDKGEDWIKDHINDFARAKSLVENFGK